MNSVCHFNVLIVKVSNEKCALSAQNDVDFIYENTASESEFIFTCIKKKTCYH